MNKDQTMHLLETIWAAIEGKDTPVTVIALSCALSVVRSATVEAAHHDGVDVDAIERLLDSLVQSGESLGRELHKGDL
jgi:acid phosphatase family membrane protein YuiD